MRLGKQSNAESSKPFEPVIFRDSAAYRPSQFQVMRVYVQFTDRLRCVSSYESGL